MIYSVRILRRAQTDLQEIHRYVARDAPSAAENLVDNLLHRIEELGSMPERGTVPRDDRLRRLGYRVVIDGQYLVFYKVLRRQVRVYRVLHGRRRYEAVL